MDQSFSKIASTASNTVLIICSGWHTRNKQNIKGFILIYGFQLATKQAVDMQSPGVKTERMKLEKVNSLVWKGSEEWI